MSPTLSTEPRSPSLSMPHQTRGQVWSHCHLQHSTGSSIHFTTSVALRDNKPGDSLTSLNLLNTNDVAAVINTVGKLAGQALEMVNQASREQNLITEVLGFTRFIEQCLLLWVWQLPALPIHMSTSCQFSLGRGVDHICIPVGGKGVEILMVLWQSLRQLGDHLVNWPQWWPK